MVRVYELGFPLVASRFKKQHCYLGCMVAELFLLKESCS